MESNKCARLQKDTQPGQIYTHHLRPDSFHSAMTPPGSMVDKQVDHALSPRLTSSAAGPAHHQTAAGAFTRSTAATSQGTMRKRFTLWLRLPSKLAKRDRGSLAMPYSSPFYCAVSCGSSLGSIKARTLPGTAAGSSGSRSALWLNNWVQYLLFVSRDTQCCSTTSSTVVPVSVLGSC